MAERHERPRILLVDLDGTLADTTHRNPLLRDRGNQRSWSLFFAQCQKDTVNEDVVLAVRSLSTRLEAEIVIVSGRPVSVLKKTRQWLSSTGLTLREIILKPTALRFLSGAQWKSQVLSRLTKKFEIVGVVDDDRRVLEALSDQGLCRRFFLPTPGIHPGIVSWNRN